MNTVSMLAAIPDAHVPFPRLSARNCFYGSGWRVSQRFRFCRLPGQPAPSHPHRVICRCRRRIVKLARNHGLHLAARGYHFVDFPVLCRNPGRMEASAASSASRTYCSDSPISNKSILLTMFLHLRYYYLETHELCILTASGSF